MTLNRASTIEDIKLQVRESNEKLRRLSDVPVLSDELCDAIISALFTDKPSGRRFPTGRATRPRTSPGILSATQVAEHPQYASHGVREAAQITGALLRWHTSGGDLHGLFGAQFRAGSDDLFARLDTLAQTLLILSGADFTAVAAWRSTGLFK